MANPAEHEPPRIRRIARGEPDYPAGLLDLKHAPEALYARGVWPLDGVAVAIVGSRAASPYGRETASRLAADLARLGHRVVSGLAHGIDAAAHQGALEAGGVTIAVLPGGLDAIVPRGHQALARRIAERGALVSERPAGYVVHPRSFVERNRLIAALARVVVVVEAAESSGALHTAEFARVLGRPRLAVPGDVDRPTARGCHALLRSGAQVCEGAADVIAAIAPAPTGAEPPQGRLLAALGTGAQTVEACARAAELDVAHALQELLRLEWAGLATAEPGGRWRRTGPRT